FSVEEPQSPANFIRNESEPMLEADGGQSSALIYSQCARSAPRLHYETLDNFPSAARGLGARSMMQSAVHGSSSEGSISTR
ncbi:hypothetical protein, partial [Bradyrhizobium sp. 48]|uniref:hypothetical protein n=1 Tax=Bradyrhizobium sp. 48 TaxID=2782676 RepID=UPI001FF82A8C